MMPTRQRIARMIIVAVVVDLLCLAPGWAAPDVNNQPGIANLVAGQTRLQGTLAGGGPADVCIYWGPTDGGTNSANWAHKDVLKGQKDGSSFSLTVDNLIYGVTYYYRCYASNDSGEAWAPATTRFTTLEPRVAVADANNRAVLTVTRGLVCWYDAAVGVTADAKGVVQAWKDLSGNGHDGTLAAGSPVLASNQIHSKPAVQFRTSSGPCGFNLDGPFFIEQQYVVVRSPNATWNSDGCFLGRRWKRSSSYRLSGKSTAFWGDQYPNAVSRNGKELRDRPFDLAPIADYMILRIDVNDGDMSKNSYQIGMADHASCDFDVAEILGYQTVLSPSDEELVGGYLAAKYGISTAYPACAGLVAASRLTNSPASAQTPTSATLSTTLTCPGSVYDVRVYWGTTDGGTDAGLWENSAIVGTRTDDASTKLSYTVTGLTPGAKYYFTFRGTNAVDSFWADKVLTFRPDLPGVQEPGQAATSSPSPTLPVTKGLACWYDAAVGVTADSQGVIQAWEDASGNGHHAAPGRGAAVLVLNQINSKPVVQFSSSWLALAGTFFAKEHYLVVRSPGAQWSGPGGLLGRLQGRGSSYNTWGHDTGFWQDQFPAAVSRNGIVLPGPAFDCSPLTRFMILKIVVNDQNPSEASYAIGNNDGLAACDFDVAEILGYEAILPPADEALVGGYLAAKYGIDTAYPSLPPAGARSAPKLAASETASVKYQGWQHSGSLYLLTTSEGANLPQTAAEENFPVLVRLNKEWFHFNEAQTNGEDIRFAASSGAPLAYHVDQWDAETGSACVWVRVPTIRGNARQEIKMYWGKAGAPSESSGSAVFNRSNGYLSVWHMNDPVQDDAGTVDSTDGGTTPSSGRIGRARHFADGKGINCGERIRTYPFASSPHTSEAWFQAERFKTTILSWGKQDAVNLRLSTTPGYVLIDSGRKSIYATSILSKSDWVQVVHTYDGQSERVYVNGRLDLPAATPSTLEILTPVRMQIGERFIGDLDEVRISNVARSADWIKLQYENQKPLQTLVGPLVQPGFAFSVSENKIALLEGESATVTARASGAQKVYWVIRSGGSETIADVDRFHFTVDAGRVTGDQSFTLQFKAVYADGVKTLDIPVSIQEDIPDPVFTLEAPAKWDGRETIELVPQISNLKALQAKNAAELKVDWTVPDIVELKEIAPGKLILKRSRNSGKLIVTARISNGGKPATQSVQIVVTEPQRDPWVPRSPERDEKPEDGQFYARDDNNEAALYYNGTLPDVADAVFLKVLADDKPFKTETQPLTADRAYAFTVKLKPGLIKYRVEFGTISSGQEQVLHTAGNLLCGDAYLINGQSNALATDTGEKSPPETNEWIRSYGGPTGRGDASGWVRDRFGDINDFERPRPNLWCNPVWKAERGEQAELGWWGMELAKRLVASQKIPIFIINGAVGGTRIDEHQPSPTNHADLKTIYGRTLWRVQQARLTHGIRAVIWHQGESDQGADGPTDGYGWETYQRYFLDMSAAWKQDFPNLRHYYIFQIWPNSCSMGNGHGDMLREVQRTLPRLYSNMDIMPTLGIKPPGPCHYPLTGWAEFARMMQPLIERDYYGKVPATSITAPNLKRVYYTSSAKDAIALEFDQPVVWKDTLAGQFYLDGEQEHVASGSANGNVVTLQLKAASSAKTITYLKEMNWSQDKLLIGANGIAALTFCEVPIEPSVFQHKEQ